MSEGSEEDKDKKILSLEARLAILTQAVLNLTSRWFTTMEKPSEAAMLHREKTLHELSMLELGPEHEELKKNLILQNDYFWGMVEDDARKHERDRKDSEQKHEE